MQYYWFLLQLILIQGILHIDLLLCYYYFFLGTIYPLNWCKVIEFTTSTGITMNAAQWACFKENVPAIEEAIKKISSGWTDSYAYPPSGYME